MPCAYETVLPSGQPVAIGVQMNSQTLNGLPTSFSDQRACYDLDGDGTIEPGMTDGERVVGHGYILDPNGPEFDPEVPFTRTFIYGAYDGEVVLRADDHA